ncbi:MAG: PIG-L family deacetylase [Verrucomicrobia bacterium]|nr:PIG-L family deacetylase [Verrucomicrobiota bacterium]MBU1910054.1 PIG-L family deacetylase [Verrucomicrobiota bacterium]
MRPSYDFLYLSPHLDDVVLSCAGQIRCRVREEKSVLVYTAMAAEKLPAPLQPNATRFLMLCRLGVDAGRVRREEDTRACARLGAEWKHDDLLEAIFRYDDGGRELYPTHESLFGPVQEKDEALVGILAERFAALPPASAVFAPLGAGGHVDHQLVRRVAEQVFGATLAYYEDYPYAARPGVVQRLTQPRREWAVAAIRLDAEARRARQEAILEYGSQLPMLFGNRVAFQWKDRWYLWRRGGERIWRHRA